MLEVTPPIPVTGTFRQAYEELNKKLTYFRTMLIKFRDKRFEVMNRGRELHGFTSGQIVYLFFQGHSLLTSGRRKFTCQFVGPLATWKCFSLTQVCADVTGWNGIPLFGGGNQTEIRCNKNNKG